MNPNITENMGSFGPGFLNQVPTLTVVSCCIPTNLPKTPVLILQTLMLDPPQQTFVIP